MGRRNRAAHVRRADLRFLADDQGSRDHPDLEDAVPCRPMLQIGITVALPRHLVWLLAGIAIGRHHAPEELPGRLGVIVDALRLLA